MPALQYKKPKDNFISERGIMTENNEILGGIPGPGNTETKESTESKCPVAHGPRKARTNTDWWPNQLDLSILHQQSSLSNPMGDELTPS